MKGEEPARGRTRAPWKLGSAGLYDRYSESAIPGWAQWALGGLVLGLGVLVAWLAFAPHIMGDSERLLALSLPFVAIVVIGIVRMAVDNNKEEEEEKEET